MTEFFSSAQVRAALAELAEIQDDLAHTMSSPRILSDDEKKDYVRKLKLFLEKQKLFFFRVSLSDDPEAVQVKEHILDTAQMFGFKTRYGMVSNPFAQGLTQGSGALTANTNKYYRRVQVANLM